MVVVNDYMSNALSLYKTDYVSIVCDVLPSVEWQAKDNITKAAKLPGAKSFNGKEHFKNGVRFAQLQSLGAWVKVQVCPSSSKGHKVRIAFNFYTPEGLQYVKKMVDLCIPIGFDAVVAKGLVTRLDIAMDFKGVKPHEFLCLSRHSYKDVCIYRDKKGICLETMYMGSVKSEFLVVVYDRGAAKSIKAKDAEKAPELFPTCGIPEFDVTRVELRHRPKMIHQVPLCQMQGWVNDSLSKVHVLKARFLNDGAQIRLQNMQRVGCQVSLLDPTAAPQLLLPKERATLASSIAKRSLLDIAKQYQSPLIPLLGAKGLAA